MTKDNDWKDRLRLSGQAATTKVKALDLGLRTGAALALCGMVAEGETIIEDAWQIDRGYDGFVEKVKSLGGKVG